MKKKVMVLMTCSSCGTINPEYFFKDEVPNEKVIYCSNCKRNSKHYYCSQKRKK